MTSWFVRLTVITIGTQFIVYSIRPLISYQALAFGGLRNPFRVAQRPGTNTFHVNDVGLYHWEEVNRLRKGRNYGWNAREGTARPGRSPTAGPRGSRTRCSTTDGLVAPRSPAAPSYPDR